MIIKHGQFKKLRRKHKKDIIVYVSGTFDLTHVNHVIFFEKAKRLGDWLVVSVGPDADIKKNKGNMRPILDQNMRLKMVDSLKPVDYCFIGKRMLKNSNNQARVLEIFRNLKPDIYYLNNDASEMKFREKVCADFGIKMIVSKPSLKYGKLTSSKIIERIKGLT